MSEDIHKTGKQDKARNPTDTKENADEGGGKEKPGDVIGVRNKSEKINNTLILTCLLGVILVFAVLTFFVMPHIKKSKGAEDKKKPDIVRQRNTDYAALVNEHGFEEVMEGQYEIETEEEYPYMEDDAIFDTLPPVTDTFDEPPPRSYSGGSGAGRRADTSREALQAKTISGIKGITPSGQRFGGIQGISAQNGGMNGDFGNPYGQFGQSGREDYIQQLLARYGGGATGAADMYALQNNQGGKQGFYQQGRENYGDGQWLPSNSVWQGTIFEAVLLSDINTDLPGEVAGIVSKNVYSSLDGRYLLIPQNSRVFGVYNSSISYSQSRVQVGWHILIRPDGYMINLGNFNATDARGASGLKGFVNDHPFQYLKALGLISAFNIVNAEYANTAAASPNQYVQNLMADSQYVTSQFASKIIDRALDVQPTITIRAGMKINIVTNTNLTFPPLKPYEVKSKYKRY